jgi:O-antigen/teichoic acid export membrane protein
LADDAFGKEMKDKLRSTAKHTVVYSIGNLSAKLIGLLLLPLYTSKLTTADYGILGILEIIGQFLIVVLGLNLYSAMIRWCSEDANCGKQKNIIFSVFASLTGIVILLNVITIPFSRQLSGFFFNNIDYELHFLFLIVSVSFEIMNTAALNILRMQERSKLYIVYTTGKFSAMLLLNFYFIVFMKMGVLGIIAGSMIANIALFFFLLPIIFKNIKPVFEYKIIKEMLRYCLPLIFTSISVMLLSFGDRFFIKHFLDYSQVGLYTLSYKIASVINVLIVQSFMLGFMPIAFKMLDQPEAKEFYNKVLKYLTVVLIVFALFISVFAREALELIARNRDFIFAFKYVPLLALTFVFKGIQYVFSLGFHYVKKTKFNAYIVMFGVLINFGLNYLLIPKAGIWGAGAATAVSSLIIVVLFYHFSRKMYYVKYDIGKVILTVSLGIIFYLLSLFAADLGFVGRIAVKSVGIILFIFTLMITKVFKRSEFAELLRSVSNKKTD